mmetsp:Transcript_16798/g.50246  ORF Transcript_16798/g.50246 Transcript_16798/m.50246 type:complete len:460 (+) Transcript_16798:199-1578(+)
MSNNRAADVVRPNARRRESHQRLRTRTGPGERSRPPTHANGSTPANNQASLYVGSFGPKHLSGAPFIKCALIALLSLTLFVHIADLSPAFDLPHLSVLTSRSPMPSSVPAAAPVAPLSHDAESSSALDPTSIDKTHTSSPGRAQTPSPSPAAVTSPTPSKTQYVVEDIDREIDLDKIATDEEYEFTVDVRIPQLWRLVTNKLFVSSTPELLLSLTLLYNFRCFERLFGSSKFVALAGFWLCSTILVEVALLTTRSLILYDSSLPLNGPIAPGPYFLIYALLVEYWSVIPVLSRFTVFSVQITDKAFTYLLAFQLMFLQGSASFLAALSGILAGLVYRAVKRSFNIEASMRCPQSLEQFCQRHILPHVHCPAPPPDLPVLSSTNGAPTRRDNRVAGPAATFSEAILPPAEALLGGFAEVRADPTLLRQLVEMGFAEHAARAALAQHNNDLGVAIVALLQQ